MDEIKKLAERIKRNPEKYKDKNVIIGLGDDTKAELLFMCGTPETLAKMLGAFIEDLTDKAKERYLN